MMLRAQFQVRALDSFRVLRDEMNASCGGGGLIPNSGGCLSIQLGIKRSLRLQCRGGRKSILISCKSTRGNSSDGGGQSTNAHDDHDHDFLQASLLISETLLHYRMWRQGFREDMRWRLPGRSNPFAVLSKETRPDMSFIGHEFLRRFQSPTIFLKVSCDGDFLLPIIVGEFAIEKLIDNFQEAGGNGDCPDQFQLVRNLVEKLGYEVKMVRITERVVNTYFARVYISKPGENEILSVDVCPSDAINVANKCKAPIHVRKQIVFTDAIRISYGMGRVHDRKTTYDVSLDSPADGPDSLSEELDIVKNMNLAVKEERYGDAAMWRDKLMELRQSRHEQ
ncbi:hypothetical protein P3X46_029124 [Hevea brasiliensis]|uniref:BFN domain-containing protein n=2 Tax=Hevea brasiliensis TaxID=3981 RepID=A0ABQ9KU67_HEVBR|nr:bifunctional nuclease 2 isoform X2 [Hevea brasiliensis]KAJ9146910.1 hypothetical protein P3X46_029124 [Hevea brasiliensis]